MSVRRDFLCFRDFYFFFYMYPSDFSFSSLHSLLTPDKLAYTLSPWFFHRTLVTPLATQPQILDYLIRINMHLNHLLASLALALPALASTSHLGCYSTVPGLKPSEQYTFQSQGYCEDKCQKAGYRVAALSSGSACACGNELPKASDKVDHAECDLPCTGYPAVKCKSAYALDIPIQTGRQSN